VRKRIRPVGGPVGLLERHDRRAGDRRSVAEGRGCAGAEPGCSARRTPSEEHGRRLIVAGLGRSPCIGLPERRVLAECGAHRTSPLLGLVTIQPCESSPHSPAVPCSNSASGNTWWGGSGSEEEPEEFHHWGRMADRRRLTGWRTFAPQLSPSLPLSQAAVREERPPAKKVPRQRQAGDRPAVREPARCQARAAARTSGG
jgi:hypothetical protein